mgnify:CR=1 FL=1
MTAVYIIEIACFTSEKIQIRKYTKYSTACRGFAGTLNNTGSKLKASDYYSEFIQRNSNTF